MSEEDIVKLLLSSNSHFEDSYDLYQDILIKYTAPLISHKNRSCSTFS